jgi:transcriptional regulator with XRE-family HTH domain
MSSGGGSVVVRRQLGVKVRRLRIAAGKSLEDVQEAGLGSMSKISRIENGKLPVKIADVWALCRLYGADHVTTDALAALTPGTQQDAWWEGVVPDWLGLYAGLEATASRIRCVDPEFIHGLVQTPAYAAAVIGADPRLTPDVVGQRVRFRMERQPVVLEAEPTPDLTVVIGEGALRFGETDVMDAQIAHLHDVSKQPNVDVRVLTFDARTYPSRGSFTLLDFDNDEDPSVAYVEIPRGALYFDRTADVADYEYVFDVLLRKSTPIKEWER